MKYKNRLKQQLKLGKKVFGTWSMLSSSSVMNVIAQAGLDFIIIDLEHGPMTFETAQDQIYATESAGCAPILRLGESNEAHILRALEIGTQSILISHVSTPEEAQQIVYSCKYYPDGNRGISPFTRNHGYSDADFVSKIRSANDQMFIGVLVEGEEGINNIEKIAAIKGIDMVYLGLYDISQSVGTPGDLLNPKVTRLVKDCVKGIEAQGAIAGSVARDRDYMALLLDSGFRFIAYRVDCAVLREGFETALHWFEVLSK